MDRAAVVLAVGIVTARLVWSGGFGWFVQQHMRTPLLMAAVVLLVLGAREAVVALRGGPEPRDPTAHDSPSVGWMLVLPIVVLLSVAPTGLGASAADRVTAYTPQETSAAFTELDASQGPVPLPVSDFLNRAIWDEERSLEGVTVRLEGLVVHDEELDGAFQLTRFLVSCCAADGIPMQVVVHDRGPLLAEDTWVVADVVWRSPPVTTEPLEPGALAVVEADAVSITPVENPPNDPYEAPSGW